MVNHLQQGQLLEDYRYFFYVTNDDTLTPEPIVFSANHRPQQESALTQLKAARALHVPVDNLNSSKADMQMLALTWNRKGWLALRLSVSKGHQRKPTK